MQPTGGARAKARSAEPCEPASRGKEQCGAALRGHACDDISRISSAYRFQRRQGSRIVAGERPPCCERAERRRVVPRGAKRHFLARERLLAASSSDLGARSIEIF
jgi:hypothetical protein